MAYVAITYEVPTGEVEAEIKQREIRLEAGLNEAVDEILKRIELAQARAYTSSSNPAPPAGSRYRRTFNLRDASTTRRTGTKLPNIGGEWYIDESKVRYGGYVLGTRQEQAPIHRNRWKSRTQVEKEVNEQAPKIVEEKIR